MEFKALKPLIPPTLLVKQRKDCSKCIINNYLTNVNHCSWLINLIV